MVLANPEEVDADLVGKDTLFDEVPDCLGMRERAIVLVMGDVAEGVEAEAKREGQGGHVYAASACRARSNSVRRSEAPKTLAGFEEAAGAQAVQPDCVVADSFDDFRDEVQCA